MMVDIFKQSDATECEDAIRSTSWGESALGQFWLSVWLWCCGWRRVKYVSGKVHCDSGLSLSYHQPMWWRDVGGQRYYQAGPVYLDIAVDGQPLCRTLRGNRAAAVFRSLQDLINRTPLDA